MAGYEWVDVVPEGKGPVSKYAALLDEIAQKPNQWARIPMKSSGGASQLAGEIRKGKKSPGKWEAVSRSLPDGNFIYLRYLGPVTLRDVVSG